MIAYHDCSEDKVIKKEGIAVARNAIFTEKQRISDLIYSQIPLERRLFFEQSRRKLGLRQALKLTVDVPTSLEFEPQYQEVKGIEVDDTKDLNKPYLKKNVETRINSTYCPQDKKPKWYKLTNSNGWSFYECKGCSVRCGESVGVGNVEPVN
ncbi:MAG: hypothetical protein KME60_24155 [Cyanomargarita calcarea GSE-NOS-MK-12-04C]|jgi:hypothetical protein|uniref:Uncharacterized protein n=1 Tax=Cyanomargarita calcarea GSE-NOS-MK-12-04C TaxID=2839659 RepID=A0A951UV40_9CYAN|nr:hypothetical protein [Cyanomargarita calcarea GSE-NOS-MK-12-04C]